MQYKYQLLEPCLSLVRSLMDQSLREAQLLEPGLSLVRSPMDQSPLLYETHLLELSRSLVWSLRC